MQLPERIFGNNWLELQHGDGLSFGFDCSGALQQWARQSLALVDERRAGTPGVWSGWTCDATELRGTWERSGWASVTNYSRREEWDCARRDELTRRRDGTGQGVVCAAQRPLCDAPAQR